MKKIIILKKVIDRMKKIITIIFLIIFLSFTSSTSHVYSEKEDYAFKPDIPLNHIVDTVIIKVRGEPKIVLTIVR